MADSLTGGGLPGAQVLHRLVSPEQVEQQPQGRAARAGQGGVAFQNEARVVVRDRDQRFVADVIDRGQVVEQTIGEPRLGGEEAQEERFAAGALKALS